MTLLSSVVDAVGLLERHGVDYAMIGGLAVSARSLPWRITTTGLWRAAPLR